MAVQLMAIVNITPDSFSDGGMFHNHTQYIKYIEQLITQGANIIDIGAESTRPGAQSISPEEEQQRIMPILSELLTKYRNEQIQFSVDTRNIDTAKAALKIGVDIINDVSALANPEIVEIVASYESARYVLMHSLTVPADNKVIMRSDSNILADITDFAEQKIAQCHKLGLPRERVIFDVGIGFGKSPEQSWQLIKHADKFLKLQTPLLFGHSRKSFLAQFTNDIAAQRDPATLAISLYLAKKGVSYLRVHNVAMHKQALSVWNAL